MFSNNNNNNSDGHYETLGEETFFQSGDMLTDTEAKLSMKYDLRIVRYVKNSLKANEQADPRIALRVYKNGKSSDGADTGGKCEHEFKMAIGKFQQIMELLEDENNFLLKQSSKALKSNNMLMDLNRATSFAEWSKAKELLLRYLAEHGWQIGRTIPLTSEHRDAVRTGKTDGAFQLDIVSFVNPASKDWRTITKDTISLSMYLCNTEQEMMLFRKFAFTKSKQERCGLLASVLLPCLSFQRPTGAFEDKKDCVILVSPAFHSLLKYYRKPGNILQKVIPQAFAAPITFQVSAEQQQYMIYNPTTPQEKLLMQMQVENLQYMNTRSTCHVMPLLPSSVAAIDCILSSNKHQPQLMAPPPPPPPPPGEIDGSVVFWDRHYDADDNSDDGADDVTTKRSIVDAGFDDYDAGATTQDQEQQQHAADKSKKMRKDVLLDRDVVAAVTKEIVVEERKKRDNEKKLYNVM